MREIVQSATVFLFSFIQNGTWEQMESENEKDEDKAETEGATGVKVSRVRFGFIICHQ